MKTLTTTGNGNKLDVYIIHQVEMIVKLLGTGAQSVSCHMDGETHVFDISYDDDRHAVMNFHAKLGHSVESDGRKTAITSPFFKNLVVDIIRFANGGEKSFCNCETVEAIKLMSASITASQNLETEISV